MSHKAKTPITINPTITIVQKITDKHPVKQLEHPEHPELMHPSSTMVLFYLSKSNNVLIRSFFSCL